jgi:hypothetical protein
MLRLPVDLAAALNSTTADKLTTGQDFTDAAADVSPDATAAATAVATAANHDKRPGSLSSRQLCVACGC